MLAVMSSSGGCGALGWEGPLPGGKHPHLAKGPVQIPIPNPHRGDIDWSLTKRILAQAGITRKEWEQAGK
jgi:hypothetical protein